MDRSALAQQIERDVLIAVVRTATAEQALQAGRALLRGGIRLLEITMTIPDSAQVIGTLAAEAGEGVVLGAGTVLTPAQGLAVLRAGARFVVSPILARPLAHLCRDHGAVSMLGGLSPTELVEAAQAGSDFIKVFPIDLVGGPAYIRAVRAPLPDLKLVPSGGVKLENLGSYLEAGAAALALGSDLLPSRLVEQGAWDAISDRARTYLTALEGARKQ